MKKLNMTVYLMPVVVILIIIILFVSINYSNYYEAIAQQSNKTKNTNDITTDNTDTFSAIGTISSLVITVPSESDDFNITNAFKVILTGEWNLSVRNGTVTNFVANFLASPMDGSRGQHIHQITNFRSENNNNNNNNNEDRQAVQLRPDNSLSVNGTADIKINGVNVWNDANIAIIIYKGNTISIDPDDEDTENHFGYQQVYGVVNRLIL
jgi:hypothetical protein